MKAKAIVISFILLFGGLSLANLLTPTRTFSENENRTLQQFPAFSGRALTSGDYTAKIDAFVTDQFAFRDGWIGVKTLSERALGRRASGGVYFADDGYLIEMFDSVDQGQFEKNLSFTEEFSRRVKEELGVPVETMLVPTASYILRNKLPAHTPEQSQEALLDSAAARLPGFVDVSPALFNHSDEPIYYKTDHHWTSLGAWYGYAAWRQSQGLPAAPLDEFDQTTLSDAFYGTTFSKANLYAVSPDTITAFTPKQPEAITVTYNPGLPEERTTDSIYELSYLDTKDKYSVFLNANQSMVKIQTGVDNNKRLLLIKDSYANTFVQFLLTDYSEIHILDLRYYKQSVYDYIQEQDISETLLLYNIKNFSGDANLFFLSD